MPHYAPQWVTWGICIIAPYTESKLNPICCHQTDTNPILTCPISDTNTETASKESRSKSLKKNPHALIFYWNTKGVCFFPGDFDLGDSVPIPLDLALA